MGNGDEVKEHTHHEMRMICNANYFDEFNLFRLMSHDENDEVDCFGI